MVPYGRNVRAAKEIVETLFTNLDDGAERIQMPGPVSACRKPTKKGSYDRGPKDEASVSATVPSRLLNPCTK